MKTILVLVVMVTAVFFWQHQRDRVGQTSASATTPTTATPRPVSEHDWAKRSLDRTNEVANQVRKTRGENQP